MHANASTGRTLVGIYRLQPQLALHHLLYYSSNELERCLRVPLVGRCKLNLR